MHDRHGLRRFRLLVLLLFWVFAQSVRAGETPTRAELRALLAEPVRPVQSLLAPGAVPEADWTRPGEVAALVGPVPLRVTVYDRFWREVEVVSAPGRYGLLLRGTTPGGHTLTRYLTVYALPAGTLELDRPVLSLADPAGALGIAETVWANRRTEIRAALGDRTPRELADDPAAALFLAALSECGRHADPDRPLDPAGAAARYWLTLQRTTLCGKDGCSLFLCPRRTEGSEAPTLSWPPVLLDGTDAADLAGAPPQYRLLSGRADVGRASSGGRGNLVFVHPAAAPPPNHVRPADSLGRTLAAILLLAGEAQDAVRADASLALLLGEFAKTKNPPRLRDLFAYSWTPRTPTPTWLPAPRDPGFPGAVAFALASGAAEWEEIAPAVAPHLAWAGLARMAGASPEALVARHVARPLGLEQTRMAPDLQLMASEADLLRIARLVKNGGTYGPWRFYEESADLAGLLGQAGGPGEGVPLLEENWGALILHGGHRGSRKGEATLVLSGEERAAE